MKNYLLILTIIFLACSGNAGRNDKKTAFKNIINKEGADIQTRFDVPEGFERVKYAAGTFGRYLQQLPLKPAGSKVKLYDGTIKKNNVYEAVVDMEIGTQDLQQCADAVMRLRGEYLFAQKRYDEISFNFNSGFTCDYKHWMDGFRVKIKGNNAAWVKTAKPGNDHQIFRAYMDEVFDYAGTLALSKLLKKKDIRNIEAGDVFIRGGTPGHAVIVTDVAADSGGNKIFMLAQSYMPAQDIQVLKNKNKPETSPWYAVKDIMSELDTPEWTFDMNDLKTW